MTLFTLDLDPGHDYGVMSYESTYLVVHVVRQGLRMTLEPVEVCDNFGDALASATALEGRS